MRPHEHEICRLKIFCITEGCTIRSGSQTCSIKNVKDFSEKSKKDAIESFQFGTRINATHPQPTQGKWKKTKKGWLCPECK